MITDAIEADPFTREIVMELVRIAVQQKIASAPSRGVAIGIVFREVLSRIDFENRTVKATEYDIGPIGDGVINIASLAVKFGHFLESQGIRLVEGAFVVPSDH